MEWYLAGIWRGRCYTRGGGRGGERKIRYK